MALFSTKRSRRKSREEAERAEEEAKAKREKEIKEAEELATFQTTEGLGISTSANIDLSLDDDDELRRGIFDSNTPGAGLFL